MLNHFLFLCELCFLTSSNWRVRGDINTNSLSSIALGCLSRLLTVTIASNRQCMAQHGKMQPFSKKLCAQFLEWGGKSHIHHYDNSYTCTLYLQRYVQKSKIKTKPEGIYLVVSGLVILICHVPTRNNKEQFVLNWPILSENIWDLAGSKEYFIYMFLLDINITPHFRLL